MNQTKRGTRDLQTAIKNLYGVKSQYLYSETVAEEFAGTVAWNGIVSLFDLVGHPNAKQCYAWSSPIEGSTKRRYYAVLKLPPIETAADAVRAAIASDFKAEN
jgi:hypothetical protein